MTQTVQIESSTGGLVNLTLDINDYVPSPHAIVSVYDTNNSVQEKSEEYSKMLFVDDDEL